MPLTFKQINDLDNSMVAAQQVSLGQVISYLSGSVSASSAFIPTSATSTITTGLNTVGFATVQTGSISGSTHTYSTVSGSTAGKINIYAWYLSGSTLTAAQAPYTTITWRAYGI